MKVFDFTDGRKGKPLGDIKVMNASDGWLVRKGDKVFKVSLADAPEGWEWTGGASWLRWENGEPVEDVAITPEEFGVEAICFCWGQTKNDKVWHWKVVGTQDWNREACRKGILRAEFSHMMPKNAEA